MANIFGMEFTQKQTDIAKGEAVCLMFAHHLFNFPSRLVDGSTYVQILPFLNLEAILGAFGKICVAIFLFLSGYGMFLGYLRAKKTPMVYVLKKLKDLYLTYWLYFLIFVPIGIWFFKDATLLNSQELRYSTEPFTLIGNFLGFRSTYNEEWWFIRLFLTMLVVSPIYLKLTQRNPILTAFLSLIIFSLNLKLDKMIDFQFCFWQISLALGMVCAKINFFSSDLIKELEKMGAIGVVAILLICFLIRHQFGEGCDFLLVPWFIYASVKAATLLKLASVFSWLGQYSFPLWLVHSFFCYYYFQPIVYGLKWSPLVFLTLMTLSLISVLAIEYFRGYLLRFRAGGLRGLPTR